MRAVVSSRSNPIVRAGIPLATIGAAVFVSLLVVLTKTTESVVVLSPSVSECGDLSAATSPIMIDGVGVWDAGRGISVRFSIRAREGIGERKVKFVAFSDKAVPILTREIPISGTTRKPPSAARLKCFEQRVLAYYPVSDSQLTDFQISVEAI